MPRLVRNALTVAQVRAASKPGILVDGNGLMLRIQKSGAKSWVQRIIIHGKRRDIGLGAADLVSLADARETAARNRAIARNGGDPRRPRVPSFATAEAAAFGRAALDWKGGVDSPTARDWRARMITYVLPLLADIPVDQVGTAAVDDVLRPLAIGGKHPTARAVGTHIAAVLRWAALREHRPNDNPVSTVLAELPKRTTAVKHHAALHYSEVGAALRRIDSGASLAKLAVRLTVLTAARQAEVRRATPDQFGLDAAVWTVPAESMKMSRVHRVPLSRQAVAVVRAALDRNGSGYVFHGRDAGPIGAHAIAAALRRAGIDATPHGFRSSFKDWARNHRIDHELSELCLAHVEGSKTVQAYARDDLLDKRRPVMQQWADYLDEGA